MASYINYAARISLLAQRTKGASRDFIVDHMACVDGRLQAQWRRLSERAPRVGRGWLTMLIKLTSIERICYSHNR